MRIRGVTSPCMHIRVRDEQEEQSGCCRKHDRAADHCSSLVVVFGEQARRGAPHQRNKVLGTHDDARHGRSQAKLSEVQGEEGQQACFSAGAQEVKGSSHSEGSLYVNLLDPLHV